MPASDTTAPLVGRDAETRALSGAVSDAAAGRGRVVLVSGAPGAGRTRLLRVAAADAEARGVDVRRAAPSGRTEPYGAIRALFADDGTADADAADRLVDELTATAPLALLLDDAHRADAESVAWLSGMAGRAAGLPLLVVVSVPDGMADGPVATTLDEIRTAPGASVVDAAPLPVRAVESWARSTPGVSQAPDVASACVEATGGIAGLVRGVLVRLAAAPGDDVVAHVREAGAALAGAAAVALLSELPDDVADTARAVAVLDDDASPATCAEVAGLDGGTTSRAVARLADVGVLEADVLRFRLPGVRTALLDATDPERRERAHARAGRVLDSRAAPAERVALQYLHAGPPADGGVVELLHAAASRALRGGDPALAVSFLERALTGPAARRRRAELLVDLGVAERVVAPARAYGHLIEALSLLDSGRERAGVLAQTVPLLSGVDAAGLVRLLERGLADLASDVGDPDAESPQDRELRRVLEALLIYAASEDVGEVRRVWEWVDRTDPETLGAGPGADALRGAHLFFSALGLRTDAAAVVGRVREVLAGGMEDNEHVQPIRMGALGLLAWTESDAEVAAILDRLMESSQLRHRPDVRAFVSALRAMVNLRCGRMREALEEARAALTVLTGAVSGEARLMVLHAAALALVELGEPEEAAGLLWPGAPESAQRSWRWNWVVDARAVVLGATGRSREALETSRESGRRLTELGVVNPATLDWRRRTARFLHDLGERDEALVVAREHLALCRRWGTHGHVGVALRVLGAVQGGPEGMATLREAQAELASSPRLFDRASCDVDLAVLLIAEGSAERVAEARDLLRRALDVADECGARVLADRARTELVGAGGRPRRGAGDVLTPAELDVARLAARGVGNQEIADELGVSRRAVEGHLTRCYRKLGIAARADLAASLAARELRVR
ncbi:AAA family ATPase [Pseudonocardia endophytica]|uniref:Regulatory LuxR family protein n=1 Tax=Pseudonocardia endophytica TaxID=401976 RepID=A0A4R1HPK4_PSEEN|nr:LuxR family transcriptional regulator [Pseudonocardia endophytica]TCK24487.1 regulatory LuxR family protein [Pseudonocardia endophytica]